MGIDFSELQTDPGKALFLAQRREIFNLGVPGFSKTTRLEPKISEDLRTFPEHFHVPGSGCVALNTTSSPVPFIKKSEILGKVSIRFSHCFDHEFTYFWKRVSVEVVIAHFLTRREKLVRMRKRELE